MHQKTICAFKIDKPGHVSVALWVLKTNTLEIFDPSGKTSDAPVQWDLLYMLFKDTLKKMRVVYVNKDYLQQEDKMCQTWIYYYLYQRALVGEPPHRIVEYLHKVHPKQRFQLYQPILALPYEVVIGW